MPTECTNSQQCDEGRQVVKARVRERQWIYLGPIVAAPIAHICVTLYRHAKTPLQKRVLFTVGIAGSTVASLGMRLYLMHHAGYAGGENLQMADRERLVTLEEKEEMENPSMAKIARDAFRGFG